MSVDARYINRGNGVEDVTPDEYADRLEALVLSGELARMAKDDPAQFQAKTNDATETAAALLREAERCARAAARIGTLGMQLAAQVTAARG